MQMQSWAIAVILGCVGGDLHAEKKICMQKSATAASIYTLCCNGITMEDGDPGTNSQCSQHEKDQKESRGKFHQAPCINEELLRLLIIRRKHQKVEVKKVEEEDAASISKIFWRQLKLSQV